MLRAKQACSGLEPFQAALVYQRRCAVRGFITANRRWQLGQSAVVHSSVAAPFLVAPEVTSPPASHGGRPPSVWARWAAWWALKSPVPAEAGELPRSELGPLVHKIWGLCKDETLLLIGAVVFLLAAAACELTIPHFATKCIFAAGEAKSQQMVAQTIKILSAIVVLYGVTSAIRGTCFSILNNRMTRRLRNQLFQRLICRETAFFDATDTGNLTSRLQADCQAVTKCISTNLNIALRNFIQAAGGGVYLYILSRDLFMTTLALTSVLWGVTLLYGNYSRRTQKVYQDVLAASNSVAEEVLSLSRVVRTFGTEEQEQRRYGSWLQRLYEVGLRQASGYGLFVVAGHIATYSSKVVALLLGCAMVLNGTLTAEQLTNFIFYVEFVTYSSLNVCDEYTELMEAVGASERVLKLLDAEAAPQIAPGRRPSHFSGRIDFEDVTFSYASRPNQIALAGVSLALRPGKLVALVGLSGSGKTTVVALLQRLYDPTGGRVLVDGEDMRELDANWYRAQIGVVTQEPRLFSTSVAENIAYGCGLHQRPAAANGTEEARTSGTTVDGSTPLQPTMDEVAAAAKAANAHAFIMALPQGYDTPVTDKLLSGGQKQRIALARALVRRPRLLVLDEATSALDAESEAQVQQALDRAMAADDRAVVVIAHRLSTVRNADTIIVMDRGKIAEQGSHLELMSHKGIYWQLICRQQYGIDPNEVGAASDSDNTPYTSTAAHLGNLHSNGDGNHTHALAASTSTQGQAQALDATTTLAPASPTRADLDTPNSLVAAAAEEGRVFSSSLRLEPSIDDSMCRAEDGNCSDTEREYVVQHHYSYYSAQEEAQASAETDVERDEHEYQQ